MTEPLSGDLLMIVAGWNLINLALAGAALGVVAERAGTQAQPAPARQAACADAYRRKAAFGDRARRSSGGVAVEFLDGEPQAAEIGQLSGQLELRRGGEAISADMVLRGVRRSADAPTAWGFAYRERTPATFAVIADLMYSKQAVLQDRLNGARCGWLLRGTLKFAAWTSLRPSGRCVIRWAGSARAR